MKTMKIYRLCATVALTVMAFVTVSAQDFTFDGLNYSVTSTDNKEVKCTGGEIKEVITIPEKVTNDGVTYTVTSIGNNAFSGRYDVNNFTRKYVIPGTVKSIANSAFYDNYYMQELVLNEGLEIIGSSAFGYAFALEEIIIPSTVSNIGNDAFITNRDKAIDIICYAPTPTISSSTFSGRTSVATLNVASDDLSAFQSAENWKEFTNIKTFTSAKTSRPYISLDNASFMLSISSSTSGATIHYTTDGTDPTSSSSVYSAPFMFAQNGTVKAFAQAE